MKIKRVLCPERLRELPQHWSWVDHRFVREDYALRCEVGSLALYLFLVCVSDARGLSYYSDPSICRQLKLDPNALDAARRQLQETELIAHEKPFYQVLSLDKPRLTAMPARSESVDRLPQAVSIGEAIRRIMGGGAA